MAENGKGAAWVHYQYDRPVDLSERGAGFIEGFAAACASICYALTDYPDAGKSYDPMCVSLERGMMHSYMFDMKDGGRGHPLVDYASFREIADVLVNETLECMAQDWEMAADRLKALDTTPDLGGGVE